jgi:outer membrane protein TolC
VAEELEARQHRQIARRQLQALVGEPVDAVAPLNVSALVLSTPEPKELEAWIAKAEDNSPEVRTLLARLDAARQEVDKARAGHRPTLDAVVEWSRSESDNINRIGSRYTSRSVGLQLSVPLYAGGGIDSTVRQAVAEETQASETLQALREDLAIRVTREFSGVAEGVLRIRALEQAVRSADQVVVSNRKSFQAGSRTTVDILDAEQQRVSALRDLAQARFVYLMAHVRLQVLAGVFDAGWLQGINAFFTASTHGAAQPADAAEVHSSRSAAAAAASPSNPRPL